MKTCNCWQRTFLDTGGFLKLSYKVHSLSSKLFMVGYITIHFSILHLEWLFTHTWCCNVIGWSHRKYWFTEFSNLPIMKQFILQHQKNHIYWYHHRSHPKSHYVLGSCQVYCGRYKFSYILIFICQLKFFLEGTGSLYSFLRNTGQIAKPKKLFICHSFILSK